MFFVCLYFTIQANFDYDQTDKFGSHLILTLDNTAILEKNSSIF